MEKNITNQYENDTIVKEFTKNTDFDYLQALNIIIITFSIFILLTFIAAFIILYRKRKQRLSVLNNTTNIQSKEIKHKSIEECELLNEKSDAHNINSNFVDQNKVPLLKYSNVRLKPDILLLSLSSQTPDYDSLFDSSPILDQLVESNSSNHYSNNIQNIYLKQNLFTKSLKLGKNSNTSDNTEDKTPFNTKESIENVKKSKKIIGFLGKSVDISEGNLKTKNLKTEANSVDAVLKPLKFSEVHEYDVVYVPHNCVASMNNRLDTETSYIRSTWKKRRSILYEELSDVVRRISARLRPDINRQSSNSYSSNRASHNLDIKFAQPTDTCRTNLSDNNNNINLNQQMNTNDFSNLESIYIKLPQSQMNVDKLNSKIVPPKVPKHAYLEQTPVVPMRTFSINKN